MLFFDCSAGCIFIVSSEMRCMLGFIDLNGKVEECAILFRGHNLYRDAEVTMNIHLAWRADKTQTRTPQTHSSSKVRGKIWHPFRRADVSGNGAFKIERLNIEREFARGRLGI